jgi:hypothetical protein
MTKLMVTITACATLLWAGVTLAAPTAQQSCDAARLTARSKYVSCVEALVVKESKGIAFDPFVPFARCRHNYFKNWTAFQTKASLTGSTCRGSRFTDNGTSVTDNLTNLVWEKKVADFNDVSGVDRGFNWSPSSNIEDGTVFSTFLATLNSSSFAGANGWRLPTFAELQTIVQDYACSGAAGGPTCSCPSNPCIDAAFGMTVTYNHLSATTNISDPSTVRVVNFFRGDTFSDSKAWPSRVRAVRGGL